MTAKSPVQFKWKPSIRIQPETVEHLRNLVQLVGVLIILAATAVILIAIAGTGPDQSFPESLMMVMKSLAKMIDV